MAKTTVALTPAGATAAAALERFKLPEMIDVARLGLAYAIQLDLELDRPSGRRCERPSTSSTALSAARPSHWGVRELVDDERDLHARRRVGSKRP